MKGSKMSNKVFRCVLIPVIAVMLGIAIASPVVAEYFAATLDNYLGRGEILYGSGGVFAEKDKTYYEQPFARTQEGKTEASHAGYAVAEKLSDEGSVLLKNNGVLPLAKRTKVTPMGYRYTNPVMTGTGSGAATLLQDFVVRPDKALANYFDVNSAVENKLSSAEVKFATKSGYKGSADENGAFAGATSSVGEFAPDIYSAADIGDYKTAVVFIGRQGGEGNDLQMTPYYDNAGAKIADHQLQLMPYELRMLDFAKQNCGDVVVIVNSPNPIETEGLESDPDIDAVLWVGTTGSRGFESMGKILCGDVNPSGSLVDIYYADFAADPTFVNYGEFAYADSEDNKFVEYEEGIYLGYKYYETKAVEMNADVPGSGDRWYGKAVVYPFGFGLHYEDELVTQTLTEAVYDAETGTITVTGNISNASSRDVKETVQIYFDPPYYGGTGLANIEKASKNLVAFDKIAVAKNSDEDFSVTFASEDMASYDYKGYYSDGDGSYVLEHGTYGIYLGKDSHDSWGADEITVENTVVYYDGEAIADVKTDGAEYVGKRASDKTTAVNLYDYVSDYTDGVGEFGAAGACDNLTRADGLTGGTTAPVGKTATAALLTQIEKSDMGTLDYAGFITERFGTSPPTSDADNGMILSELRGAAYDDERWDKLLDQLVYTGNGLAEINKLLGNGSFNTAKITAIGKGTTSESDGPQAIGKTGVSDGTGAACAYPAEVVIASAWNADLAEAMGIAIGNEALAHGSNGWYAPACNIHRSPFLGRVYEYFSEDAVLSGYMAMYVVQGAASKGYTPYIKHFAVNDQELGRWQLCTWANEQTLREIYFKPFEIAVKYGKVTENYIAVDAETGTYEVKTIERRAATGMMTSMNRIGGVWASLDRSLCTTLLRGEWGFEGAVITDSATPENAQLLNAVQAGNDFFLTFMSSKLTDSESAAARLSIRNAVHNICYAVVNSNAMQNVGPGETYEYAMSPWKFGIIAIDIVCGIVAAGGVLWIVLRTLDEKKHPEKYLRLENKKSGN